MSRLSIEVASDKVSLITLPCKADSPFCRSISVIGIKRIMRTKEIEVVKFGNEKTAGLLVFSKYPRGQKTGFSPI